MSIVSAGIRCELREVVLRDKPAEMIAISPKATVPVLQLGNGKIIDESLDIMRWALTQNDPEGWLRPAEKTLEAAIALIEDTQAQFKPHLDRYKYPDRYDDANSLEHRSAACDFIEKLEEQLSATPFLFGERVCIADMATFPFIRQFANTDSDWFASSPWRHTQAWLTKLIDGEHFRIAMKKYPQWHSGDAAVFFP